MILFNTNVNSCLSRELVKQTVKKEFSKVINAYIIAIKTKLQFKNLDIFETNALQT